MIRDDLKSLAKFKEIMASILFESEDITDMVMPEPDDPRFDKSENFFGARDLPAEDPVTGEITYVTLTGYCFDIPYIKESITDDRTIITVDSSITKIQGEYIKEVGLDVCVLSPRDTADMNSEQKELFHARGYHGNKIDMIVSAIHTAVMEQARDFGIGKIRLAPEKPVISYLPNDNWYGRKISFLCSDFYKKTGKQR